LQADNRPWSTAHKNEFQTFFADKKVDLLERRMNLRKKGHKKTLLVGRV
jgi:hypothetical protein